MTPAVASADVVLLPSVAATDTVVRDLALPSVDWTIPANSTECYGAASIAAEYARVRGNPEPVRAIWQHGWTPSWWLPLTPNMVMSWHGGEDRSQLVLVARKDEESFLQQNGFLKAKAIGLPIVYADASGIPRMPGSLLVMPAHSLEYTTHAWKFEEYAEVITALRPNFSEIIVCIHPSCFEKGYWVNAFRTRGFPVLAGAAVEDRNALKRIRRIISSFEFVTTNGFGSHIAYAAFLGARVSIYGPYAEYHGEDFQNTRFYRENPELLEPALDVMSEKTFRAKNPELFCHPLHAACHVSWGSYEIGFENRVSPAELRKLFGWRVHERALRRARAAVPARIKRYAKLALDHGYREREREVERLRALPPYTRTATNLLGHGFEIVDPPAFLLSYADIFERGIYRFVTTADAPRIIDGGANVGLSVLYFKRLYPKSRITALEADPEIFAVLQRNCATFGLRDVELVQKALWTSDTTVSFRHEGGDAGRITTAGDRIIEVPGCRLRDWLDAPVDLLKLDIEGAETAVLLDCQDRLRNVENIFVEYHSLASEPQTLHTLVNLLASAGFRLHIDSVAGVPASPQPFVWRSVHMGMDLQLNIFGVRAGCS